MNARLSLKTVLSAFDNLKEDYEASAELQRVVGSLLYDDFDDFALTRDNFIKEFKEKHGIVRRVVEYTNDVYALCYFSNDDWSLEVDTGDYNFAIVANEDKFYTNHYDNLCLNRYRFDDNTGYKELFKAIFNKIGIDEVSVNTSAKISDEYLEYFELLGLVRNQSN